MANWVISINPPFPLGGTLQIVETLNQDWVLTTFPLWGGGAVLPATSISGVGWQLGGTVTIDNVLEKTTLNFQFSCNKFEDGIASGTVTADGSDDGTWSATSQTGGGGPDS